MTQINSDILADILHEAGGVSAERAATWAPPLAVAMETYAITTDNRATAFLANVLHETGRLRWTTELGSDAYLSKYDTGRLAERLGNTPEADGDGQRYRGRGLLQVTGRANYASITHRLNLRLKGLGVPNFVEHPERLAEPTWAAFSAGEYWEMRRLNAVADAGDFTRIVRSINGGLNGHKERESLRLSLLAAFRAAQGVFIR